MGGDDLGTIVIGGGQAGLSVGHHLERRGLPYVILDGATRTGDTWRNRWDSLRLFTPAKYSGLDGMPFPAPHFSFPTKDETADYLEEYAKHFGLHVRHDTWVQRLSRGNDGLFVVSTEHDQLRARNVVVATPSFTNQAIPSFASQLDGAVLQLTSSAYRRPSQLRDGAVLVVGAGNSSGAAVPPEVQPAASARTTETPPADTPRPIIRRHVMSLHPHRTDRTHFATQSPSACLASPTSYLRSMRSRPRSVVTTRYAG